MLAVVPHSVAAVGGAVRWLCARLDDTEQALGLVVRPAVVGFANRGAYHIGHEQGRLGRLVVGHQRARVGNEFGNRRVHPRPQRHERGDLLPPPLAGGTHHDRVVHRRMLFERGLDLFGEDLLAPTVDADRAAAEHGNRSVALDACKVTGHHPPLACEDRKRLCSLVRVLEVANRNVPAAGQLTHDARQALPTIVAGVRTATAIAIWSRLASLNPDSASIRFDLVNAYLAAGKPERAYLAIDQLPEKDRDGAAAWHARGVVLMRLQRPEAAISSYEKAFCLEEAKKKMIF